MKVTIVPAQVTTVEDRVTGALTLSQLLILVTPVCFSGVLYILFPPSFKFRYYKVVISLVISLTLGVLALRIKGQLVVNWVFIILRFIIRPRYFIYDKNDLYLREIALAERSYVELGIGDPEKVNIVGPIHYPRPTPAEIALLEFLISEPNNSLSIQQKRDGGLRVVLKEAE